MASYFVTNVFVRQLHAGIKENVAAHISSSIMPLQLKEMGEGRDGEKGKGSIHCECSILTYDS